MVIVKTILFLLVFAFCVSVGECQLQELFRDIRRLFSGDRTDEFIETFLPRYDFIVIGSGSGGSVVANRLTENPNWNVLLLEAGRDESFISDVPLAASLQSATGYNWGYKSEKLSTACLGLIDQRCNLVRGKALGGTSVINFLLYTRGNRLDFDRWESLGNTGWGYKDVLPYFIRSENCTLCDQIDDSYHGKNGYLNVEHARFETPMMKLFLKSGQNLGYRINDPNGRMGLGFSKVQATMKNGVRCSAAKAFIRPALHRKNLHVSIRSRVTKILIDQNTKKAYGVEFVKNRKRYVIYSDKEVILSAGTLNSPHLLMLSGVGPTAELQRVKIPVIQDLKVGYNFHDHTAMSTLAFLVNESVTISDLGIQNPLYFFNYLSGGRNPFSIPGGAEALGFVKTKYSTSKDDYPDMEFVLGAGALNGDVFGSLRNLLGIPDKIYEQVYVPHFGKPSFGIATVLLKPKSRGRVTLRDANPFHWPVMYPNYYAEEEDVAVMVEGIKMAVALGTSKPFQRYASTLNTIPFPQCANKTFGSDQYWACAVRYFSTTLGHHVGTCKMGPKSDPDAVVDPELKVHGIQGLRVVDASVLPEIVAGHTNAVIFMIGEKVSDMIKKDWMS